MEKIKDIKLMENFAEPQYEPKLKSLASLLTYSLYGRQSGSQTYSIGSQQLPSYHTKASYMQRQSNGQYLRVATTLRDHRGYNSQEWSNSAWDSGLGNLQLHWNQPPPPDYEDCREHEPSPPKNDVIASDLTGCIKENPLRWLFIGQLETEEGRWGASRVSIKTIQNLGDVEKQIIQQRIRRELAMWNALKHPNILYFYGFAADIGLYGAIISPWNEYGTMSWYLRNNTLTLGHRVELLQQVVMAVNCLHSHDPAIAHGNLKPASILMSHYKQVQICDFDISHLTGASYLMHIRMIANIDTAGYYAPELVNNTATNKDGTDLDVQSSPLSGPTKECDIYALGCLTYEFVYGKSPYSDILGEFIPRYKVDRVWNAISEGKPPAERPKDQISPSLAQLWDLLETSWSPNPSLRPTVGEFVSRLQLLKDKWSEIPKETQVDVIKEEDEDGDEDEDEADFILI